MDSDSSKPFSNSYDALESKKHQPNVDEEDATDIVEQQKEHVFAATFSGFSASAAAPVAAAAVSTATGPSTAAPGAPGIHMVRIKQND